MSTENGLRSQLSRYCAEMHARGWVANHDGNITHRISQEQQFLATPTATSKARVTPESILTVDGSGAKVGAAGGRPFSEIGLHLAVYAARPDVKAVVHAHPPHATGFAVAGLALDVPMIAEAAVSLGPSVPLVPFAAPGAASASALAPYLGEFDAVLLANHGVLAWGSDLEQAYLRLELVEHLARIALVARQLGAVRPLPASVLPALAEARTKAGLGPRARGGAAPAAPTPVIAPKTVIACAPAPSDAPVVVRDSKRANPELAAIIRDEIARALRSG
jgi:L-fuculose-phosphate aldolase